jgi:serine/threonine protein kinase
MADEGLVGRQLGGFEVLDVLGRGGFATVYRAKQIRLGRDVALKVLDPVLARDPDAARRFDKEGWSAAGLDHPCIVPVYEAGEDDGIWYLAMRLVRGHSLAVELKTHGLPPAARTAAVVRAVAEALDHAHDRQLLHRDVKPANILLEGDRVWLSDFGIAATTNEVGYFTKGAIGTLDYMAPEQAQPGEADARSDVYSLGCVVYECVTGRAPFSGRSMTATLFAHAAEPVPLTGTPVLDEFFARALAKQPDERFQKATDLAAGLDAIVEHIAAPATGANTVLPSDFGPAPENPTLPGDAVRSDVSPPRSVSAEHRGQADTLEPITPVVPASADRASSSAPEQTPVGAAPKTPRRRGPLLIVVALIVVAGVAAAVVALNGGKGGPARASANVQGPASIRDADGATYDIPGGWHIGTVTATGTLHQTTILQGTTPAVLVTVEGNKDETASALAARSADYPCPAEQQQPSAVGGASGVKCVLVPNTAGATSADDVTVYYANQAHRSWTVLVEPGLDQARLAGFLSSLKLPA